jgi:hypothetical protein
MNLYKRKIGILCQICFARNKTIENIVDSIHDFGRCLHLAINNLIRNKKIIHKYSYLLEDGIYRCSIYGDYMFKKQNKQIAEYTTFKSITALNKYAIPFVRCLYRLVSFKIRDNCFKDFCGTELLISSSRQEYKVFDKKTCKVLTVYSEKRKLKQILTNKAFFAKYFKVPQTININYNKSYCIEEYIIHNPFDPIDAIDSICEDLLLYLLSTYKNYSYDNDEDRLKAKLFSLRFGDSVLLESTIGLPKTSVHGDLWSSNVIFDGHMYFVTDFERVGVRFFLFDFFCFIFSEWLLKNDDRLLMQYNNGRFDNFFAKLPWDYNPFRKDLYLLAFLIDMTNERWSNYTEVDNKIKEALIKYIPTYYRYEENNCDIRC